MSGAKLALDTLRAAARISYTETFTAGAAYTQGHALMMRQDDFLAGAQATLDLLVAVEDLAAKAEAAASRLRSALAQAMEDTGAPNVQAKHHTAHLARKPDFVQISDPDMIPQEYWTEPQPKIDTVQLRKALKDAKVPGASLIPSNERTLVVKARSDK